MCRETFELSQNLWNSDGGTAERTLDRGSKSFERSAVDWWWSRVHRGVWVCVCVCVCACLCVSEKWLKTDKSNVWIWTVVFYGCTSKDVFKKSHVWLLRGNWTLSNEIQPCGVCVCVCVCVCVAVLLSLMRSDNAIIANHWEPNTAGAPL